MRVLETRRAHMDMRPRARAMMMSSRDVASMATTGIAIGARCARACVDARERCLARDGISSRMFCFIRACAVRS